MRNPYQLLRELLPEAPLLVGTVMAVDGEVARIELPGGGVLHARGAATVGQMVFVRDGAIEGDAPTLPVEVIEI